MWDRHVFPKIKKGGPLKFFKASSLLIFQEEYIYQRTNDRVRAYDIPENMVVCRFDHLSNIDRLPFWLGLTFKPLNCTIIYLFP